MKKTEESGISEPSGTHAQESRRKFLEQAGKLAVYTPPAMMLMMKPSLAFTILSGGNGIPTCDDRNGDFGCNGEFFPP